MTNALTQQSNNLQNKPVHSPIGASSMHRWAECPGSINLSKKAPPARVSEYAQLGTAAHALAEACIKEQRHPKTYLRHPLKQIPGAQEVEIEGAVDDEMVEAVQLYLDTLKQIQDKSDCKIHIEHRFDLSAKVYPGLYGTSDCVIYRPEAKELYVIDYKHGAGVPVNVQNNRQLKYYGLGAMMSLDYPADKVFLGIVQPRCRHSDGPVRFWETDSMELLDFAADLIDAAKATQASKAPLKAGTHCKFCPAAPICPEMDKRALQLAQEEFTPVNAGNYDPQAIADRMKWFPVLKNYMEAVQKFAYEEVQQGRGIPGYKLVQKRQTRKWKKDWNKERFCLLAGLDPDSLFERKMKSPAQVEKIKKDAKKHINDFVVAESSGTTLVPEHDKRPAVTAGEEFLLEDMLS